MERDIVGKRPHFRPQKRGTSLYRVLILLSLILAGVWVLLSFQRGQIEAPFQATPTPTRTTQSYILEAQAYFDAGKLDDPDPPLPTPPRPDAIDTYQKALKLNPNNAQVLAELARIQTYSTSMLRSDTERLDRLKQALDSSEKALQLAPDDSTTHAIRSFVLDWYASNPLVPADERQLSLGEAYSEANRAIQLDANNALAQAYYAEILVDQQKWSQAETFALKAVNLNPDSMDTHRVYGYVLENLGQYNSAIQQYLKAAEISPNLTFLYIRIGQNYREGIRNPDLALEYFDRAARINEGLNVQNPIPYIEIAKTYTQQGQFFAASANAEKALSLDKTNPSTYGQLGIIFIRARNYEGAMPLLKCAVRGCTADENDMGGNVAVEGLPLTNSTVAYYYVEYGTVMAFLSRPAENYCDLAVPVLEEVRHFAPDDPILIGIVEDSEGICRGLGSLPGSIPTPAVTASAGTDMPTGTPGTPIPSAVTPTPPGSTPTEPLPSPTSGG